MKDEKQKALNAALVQIEKDFGKETLQRLGDRKIGLTVDTISTGVLPLDIAIGIGGIPRGRVVELFGVESGGKSTLSMAMVANIQKSGGTAAIIDAEMCFDTDYARQIGVDVENLYICQPDSGEQGLEVVERLVRSNAIDIIVVDSVAALVPKAEIEGEMGQAVMGMQARLMSQALRKLTPIISKSRTIVLFINQIRQKIGIMFGNPETTPGGLALKFYSSLRLDIRPKEKIKNGDTVIGNLVKVKVVKNKVAPPFQQAEFEIIFGKGIPREGCVVDMGIEHGIIEKAGSWISYKGEKIGQGRDQANEYLKQNPLICDEIEKAIREKCLGVKEKVVEAVAKPKVDKK